jgi:hypothetical protein
VAYLASTLAPRPDYWAQAKMSAGVDLRCPWLQAGSRSARATRGEPRPVHISLIAAYRVYNSVELLLVSPQATNPRQTG